MPDSNSLKGISMGIFKRLIGNSNSKNIDKSITNPPIAEPVNAEKGLFSRLRDGLTKTRASLSGSISELLLGKKFIDADLIETLETQLISADIGIEATDEIIESIRNKVSQNTRKSN